MDTVFVIRLLLVVIGGLVMLLSIWCAYLLALKEREIDTFGPLWFLIVACAGGFGLILFGALGPVLS